MPSFQKIVALLNYISLQNVTKQKNLNTERVDTVYSASFPLNLFVIRHLSSLNVSLKNHYNIPRVFPFKIICNSAPLKLRSFSKYC